MSKEKIIHTSERYGLREEAKEFPLMCVIAFTYVCNAKCLHCPFTNSDLRARYKDTPHMKGETFRIIADQCGEHGAWIRLTGGGEPMLHPEAVPLIEYAKKVGAKVGLISNGSVFNAENSRRLIEAGVDMIEFSVDAADPESYAGIRKGLDWGKLVGNVEMMVSLRNRLKSPTKIIASGINQKGADMEAAARFWGSLVDEFQNRKYLTYGISDPSRSADAEPYLPPEQRIPCPYLFERLNIDSRGKVVLCALDLAGNTNMGDVHKEGLAQIWLGEKFEYYRNMHLEKRGNEVEPCKDCPDWKFRSWQHNYWKIVKKAEARRFDRLEFHDMEGSPADAGDA